MLATQAETGGYSGASSSVRLPCMKPAAHLSAVTAGIVLAALAAGCATEETQPGTETPRRARVDAITGSHIPNKTALPPQSDSEREKTVERMRELQKTSPPVQTRP